MKKNKQNYKLLMLESDSSYASQIVSALNSSKFYLEVCSSGNDFLQHMSEQAPDLILLNIGHTDNHYNGLEIFNLIITKNITDAKIITYYNSTNCSWINEVHQIGEYFLYSNFASSSISQLIVHIDMSLLTKNAEIENVITQTESHLQLRALMHSNPFIGESDSIKDARARICRLAKSDEDMFVIGETGTGKEVAAYYYYFNSLRFGKSLNTVNCSALTETLIESELFGHVKGSFTNADRNKVGLFELSNYGILFLDEITNLSLAAQSKLLRAIENKEIQIVGGEAKKVDTKLVFASNATYERLAHPEIIRKDLFYRIESNIVELSPLRERGNDILLLLNYFINKYSSSNISIDYSSINKLKDYLLEYYWPGNVRELKNFCKSLLINNRVINADTIKKQLSMKMKMTQNPTNSLSIDSYPSNFRISTSNFERDFLLYNLNANNWHISSTADKLGIERTTLYKKIKQYNLKKS